MYMKTTTHSCFASQCTQRVTVFLHDTVPDNQQGVPGHGQSPANTGPGFSAFLTAYTSTCPWAGGAGLPAESFTSQSRLRCHLPSEASQWTLQPLSRGLY